jgi:hypothetical protein
MPKYIVFRTVHYTYNCEADSEEDALQQAAELAEEDFDIADEDEMTVELIEDEEE